MTVGEREVLIVAIDGPSGVGKSTAARLLAGELGVPYLDTGSMYRALGLLALRRGVDPGDEVAATALADGAVLELRSNADGGFGIFLDGDRLGDEIRRPEVSDATSALAVHSGVRRRMVELQRACAATHGGVVEGRDIGSRVFPDTPWKFFLDADPRVRAERRFRELEARDLDVTFEQVYQDLQDRDRRDRERADSPLRADESYQRIDTTDLGADAVVRTMLERIRG